MPNFQGRRSLAAIAFVCDVPIQLINSSCLTTISYSREARNGNRSLDGLTVVWNDEYDRHRSSDDAVKFSRPKSNDSMFA